MMLFFLVFPAIVFSIAHSYRKNGPRLTFNFFFFALLYASRWVLRKRFSPVLHLFNQDSFPALSWNTIISEPARSVFTLTLILLLALFLYCSWQIAERITMSFSCLRNKVFVTLFISGLVMSGLSSVLELAGLKLGWWSFPPAMPFGMALASWFYFSLYFLAAFLLIELSPFRDKPWKCVFVLSVFIHPLVAKFIGNGFPILIERATVLVIFACLMFFYPLPFDNYYRKKDA